MNSNIMGWKTDRIDREWIDIVIKIVNRLMSDVQNIEIFHSF